RSQPEHRPAALALDSAPGPRTHRRGLTLHEHTGTGADSAEVRFTARYRVCGGSAVKLAVHSRILRVDGRWSDHDA
ncbi:hypothetical protein AAGG60_21760, partial [Stenotrophomonas maltophilia]